jgi:prepilin-type N-terminal cleavage/methylation domain-containing protein
VRGARHRRRARGFTLIELLIAAALLAVLAVLSWRGLDAVLSSRKQIVAASDELRALMVAFAQLDEDLRRSWPVRLLKLQQPSIGFSVSGEQAVATMELLRESTGSLEPTQLQRVAWRLRDGRLERGFGGWSPTPTSGFDASVLARAATGLDAPRGTGVGTGEAGSLVWQPVLVGVSQLTMQAWIEGQGWVAAEALVGQLRGPGAVGGVTGGTTGTTGMSGATVTTVAVATGTGTGSVAAGIPGQPATPQVTGLLVRVVRADGRVLQRIFPVKD